MRNQAQAQDVGDNARAVNRTNIKLAWRKGKKAPRKLSRYYDAVVDNSTVYYKNVGDDNIYAYCIPNSNWSTIPDCPYVTGFANAVIDGVVTTVGGFGDDTNKLFSLTGEGSRMKWTENSFPPMPTARFSAAILCTETALIVAGGYDYTIQSVNTVEVLNTETRQWHTAPNLPEPLADLSLTLCGDLLYLLVGVQKDGATKSVFSCSLSSLFLSTGLGCLVSTLTRSIRGSIWNRVADLLVAYYTGVRPLITKNVIQLSLEELLIDSMATMLSD